MRSSPVGTNVARARSASYETDSPAASGMPLRKSSLPLSVRQVEAAVRAKKSGCNSCWESSIAAASSTPSIRRARVAHLSECVAEPSVVLDGLVGHAVDVSGRTLGTPQNRCAAADDDVLDAVFVERLEDLRLVEFAVLVGRFGHVARRPSSRSSAANASRSAAVRNSRPSFVRVTSSAVGPSWASNRRPTSSRDAGRPTVWARSSWPHAWSSRFNVSTPGSTSPFSYLEMVGFELPAALGQLGHRQPSGLPGLPDQLCCHAHDGMLSDHATSWVAGGEGSTGEFSLVAPPWTHPGRCESITSNSAHGGKDLGTVSRRALHR